jgi:pimeloyl-ACP methyl ester carboxylesterase
VVVPGKSLVEFFEAHTSDRLRLLGLLSRAEQPRWLVVHVHGYGGDFFSNQFVRAAHEYYPAHGISFLSFNLRTAAYVSEIYSETSVNYVGSSIANQDDAAKDIDGVLSACGVDRSAVILQGHSFGTNIVKRYARMNPEVARVIFLSPADSVALYEQWLDGSEATTTFTSEDQLVRWDLFGMAVGAARYALPITGQCMKGLLRSESFNEWSRQDAVIGQDALVVVGERDPISNLGNTADEGFLRHVIPNLQISRIDGSMHIFSGFEHRLCQTVTEWILAVPT